jgi:hypothetical protein
VTATRVEVDAAAGLTPPLGALALSAPATCDYDRSYAEIGLELHMSGAAARTHPYPGMHDRGG